jgi:predicted naringenin-chalcone synthase
MNYARSRRLSAQKLRQEPLTSTRAFLSNFHIARPRFEYEQDQLLDWLAHYHLQAAGQSLSEDQLSRKKTMFNRFGCNSKRIANRGSDLNEFQNIEFEKNELYRASQNGHEIALKRTLLFENFASEHVMNLYKDVTLAPRHIMHVTCTGYSSPSPVQTLVDAKKWNAATEVTHLYHMGCYAALPAIRLGAALANFGGERSIDIVHTELCSLQLDMSGLSAEQAVIQSLFGDGSIRYSVGAEKPQGGLELLGIKEFIVPGTRELMSWKVGNSGMLMTLSREVPEVIVTHLPGLLEDFYASLAHSHGPINSQDCLFAIHPGGPRIIDTIRDSLHLSEQQIQHSADVLKSYGNMSSATLPHVWQKMIVDENVRAGQMIVSLAFGPGLTVFAALYKKI